jgi:amino acid adenylation domain-containing protein
MKNVEDVYPLSPMQEGMLFHTLLAPEAGDYLTQLTGIIEGARRLAALERGWAEVIARHPILRTAFVWETLDEPLQVVQREAPLPCDRYDWRRKSVAEQSEAFERFLAEDRARGFDLAAAPLMRLTVFEIADETYRFVWTHHHLLLDGWSLPLVMRELFAFAEAALDGRKLRLPSPRPYRDYIAWLAGRDESEAEAYWREALAGFTAPTPVGGASVPSHEARSHGEARRVLSRAMTAMLSAFAREQRLTLNTLVQGAWALLLHYYSSERDVVFGATVSGRPPELEGVESMIGLFINTQPVRCAIRAEEQVGAWLAALQRRAAGARRFEHCRLTSIQGWTAVPRNVPLFESIVIFENYPAGAFNAPESALGVRDVKVLETTNYPLALIAAPGETLELRLNYDRARFEDEDAAAMLARLEALLAGLAENPDRKLADAPLMSADEQRTVLLECKGKEVRFRDDRCLHELFEEQAARTPDAPAVVFQGGVVSYAELNRRAGAIAHALGQRGFGPEVLAAVALERSPEMIAAMLGVLKAGGAFLPIGVDQPPERIDLLLKDACPHALVSRADFRERAGASAERFAWIDIDEAAAAESRRVASRAAPRNLAYVIYTSGSTGRPKGVMVEHRGVCNLASAQAKLFGIRSGVRVLQFAAPTFDAAVSEIFVTLLNGGVLHLARREQLAGAELARLIDAEGINVVTLPPSVLATLPDVPLPTLATLVVAGEPCGVELARRWSAGRRFINAYGPTEATVCATAGEYDGGDRVTIGRPIDNVRVYIVDSELRPVPAGVPGELVIGGVGVGRGYLQRPSLTRERFLPDPFATEEYARVYRTGDRARRLADGSIEFLGRLDRQVKIRGFRIEPGEIEAALMADPAVRDAVVIDREDTPGDRRLAAYVTSPDSGPVPIAEVRARLHAKLPDYMIPAAIVAMDALPLTAHGKLDRAALPPPNARANSGRAYIAPRNAVEQALASLWQQVLGLEQVSVEDSFFDLGGHSLLALQLVSRIREEFGIELPLQAVFSSPTIAGVSSALMQDPSTRDMVDKAAQVIAATIGLSDDELEALVAEEAC